MTLLSVTTTGARTPKPAVVLELLKPITWFAPMWAFGCGVVSAGVPVDVPRLIVGIILTGPLVCAASQAVTDWFDRHVDAINEPDRPIPSGRLPGRWGLYVAFLWTGLSLLAATLLGVWGFVATVIGLALAWAYSAPPFRLKRDGWIGNAAVGACYEGLPWFTGAAVMLGSLPDARIIALAVLYSVGAHGIMTLNDFKSIEGDRQLGLASIPARRGARPAAILACVVMAGSQAVVIALLLWWGLMIAAAIVAALLLAQFVLMRRLIAEPKARAAWYNATGTTLYVIGMMVCAVGLANAPDAAVAVDAAAVVDAASAVGAVDTVDLAVTAEIRA
ncbi:MAG: chlorophyll synthase ChlG [Pseudomonadota bacterium]